MKNLHQNNEKLKIDVKSLFEFSKIVNQEVNVDFILNFLILTIMGKLLCNKAIVFFYNNENELFIKLVRGVDLTESKTKFKPSKKYSKLINLKYTQRNKDPLKKFLIKYGFQYLAPLNYRNKQFGYIGFTRFRKSKLKKEEIDYLNSIINITASALQQKLSREELIQLNRELDKKIHQMNTLFDITKEFTSILNKEIIIKLFTLSLMGQFGVSKYAIYLNENGTFKNVDSRECEELDCKLLNEICNIKKPFLISEESNKKIKNKLQNLGLEAVVPIVLHDQIYGILFLGQKVNRSMYTTTDLEFLSSLSNIFIISLENARLFQQALEKQRMEDELIIAREIQQGLFPKAIPKHLSLDISAVNIPSKIVGGDYYDIIRLGEDEIAFVIADVSGKGTPASLLMASIHAMLHALISLRMPASELVKKINDLIFENTSTDRFITFLLANLNTQNNLLTYVNAGHNPPILLKRNGDIKRLDKGGVILGIAKENIIYEEETVQLEKGDLLVMFTDGVTEAMNAELIEYGEERLISILKEISNLSAEAIKNRVVDIIKKYSGENQTDDITMIVIKIL